MSKLMLLLLLPLPVTALGQGVVPVSPQHCVWRAGDNPAWSATNLDESGWRPYAQWKLNPAESRIWVRCHVESLTLAEPQPAIQVRFSTAYQVFMNGILVGSNGDVDDGFFSMDSIRVFPFPPALAANGSNVLSLRIVYRFAAGSWETVQSTRAAEIRVGAVESLRDNRAGVLVLLIRQNLTTFVPMVAIGIIGLVLLGFSLPDRAHPELILLGLACLFIGLMFVNFLCGSIMTNEPAWANLAIYSITCTANLLAQTAFYFVLARRRIPVLFKLLIAAWFVRAAWPLAELLLPPQPSLRLDAILSSTVVPIGYILLGILLGLGPFIAFWPYNRIPRRARAAAGLSATWGAILIGFFLTGGVFGYFSRPSLLGSWLSTLFPVQSIVQACVVIALIALVVREQRQVAVERSLLAGEMEAAREIQQYLIPQKPPETAGLTIRSVYLPSRNVGGDFFQVLPDSRNNSTLIVVGDVAGKGLKAGMLSALIVGAIRTAFQFTGEPAAILALLNGRLQGRGLVTCLAMRIDRNGSVELANAGHLPPYVNGDELTVEGSFPLGAVPEIEIQTVRFKLAEGDSMLLVSDGVVEARNAARELFGFDRTRSISTQSAEAIARAAQQFGQEDDITVLTLTFALAEVIHA